MCSLSASEFDSALTQFNLVRVSDVKVSRPNYLEATARNIRGAFCRARIMAKPQDTAEENYWSGEVDAASIQVPKPILVQREDWTDNGIAYRLVCTSFTESPSVSASPNLIIDDPR